MTRQHPPLTVKVEGELACFTRPEMKVERVSYPVMTPTAAKGVLEAIYWKPEFTWQVEEIQVLQPIRYTSFVRNEISSRQTVQTARWWQREGGGFDGRRQQEPSPKAHPRPSRRRVHHQGRRCWSKADPKTRPSIATSSGAG